MACWNAHNGGGPCRTTIGVRQHLGFVDNGDVHRFVERAHFNRRRQMACARHFDALFASCERCRDATIKEGFPEFVRQKTKGRKGETALRVGESVQCGIGLARVGWSRNERDAALERTCCPEMSSKPVQRGNAGDGGITDLGATFQNFWSGRCCTAPFGKARAQFLEFVRIEEEQFDPVITCFALGNRETVFRNPAQGFTP